MRKPVFTYSKTNTQIISCAVTDQRLCFRYIALQSLYFLNTKFQASSHRLWLFSPVCVEPGLKPRRQIFSRRGSFMSVSVLYSPYVHTDNINFGTGS